MALSREICKMCFDVIRVGFKVPDQVWRDAIPGHLVTQTVCLSCFTRLADEKMLKWDDQIEFFPVSLPTSLEGKNPDGSV